MYKVSHAAHFHSIIIITKYFLKIWWESESMVHWSFFIGISVVTGIATRFVNDNWYPVIRI